MAEARARIEAEEYLSKPPVFDWTKPHYYTPLPSQQQNGPRQGPRGGTNRAPGSLQNGPPGGYPKGSMLFYPLINLEYYASQTSIT
jgi:hypothetical protein